MSGGGAGENVEMSEFNKLPEEAAQCSAHTAAPVTSRMQQHSQDILPDREQRILSTDTRKYAISIAAQEILKVK